MGIIPLRAAIAFIARNISVAGYPGGTFKTGVTVVHIQIGLFCSGPVL
jgi:hypothetical protein